MNKRKYKLFKGLFAKYCLLVEKFDELHAGRVNISDDKKVDRVIVESEMLEVSERMTEALQ